MRQVVYSRIFTSQHQTSDALTGLSGVSSDRTRESTAAGAATAGYRLTASPAPIKCDYSEELAGSWPRRPITLKSAATRADPIDGRIAQFG